MLVPNSTLYITFCVDIIDTKCACQALKRSKSESISKVVTYQFEIVEKAQSKALARMMSHLRHGQESHNCTLCVYEQK